MKKLLLLIVASIATQVSAVDVDLPRVIITDPLISAPTRFKIGTKPKSLGHILKAIGGIQASESDVRIHQAGKVVEDLWLEVSTSGQTRILKFGRDDALMWSLVMKHNDVVDVRRHPFRWTNQYNKKIIPRGNRAIEGATSP